MTITTLNSKVSIFASQQKVFDYVSDISKHPEWSGGELKIEEVTPGPIAVGKEYFSKGEAGPEKERPNKVKVNLYEPPNKFGFISTDPTFGEVRHVFTIEPNENGVIFTRTTTIKLKPIFAVVFRILINPLLGNPQTKKSLTRLKSNLETNSP